MEGRRWAPFRFVDPMNPTLHLQPVSAGSLLRFHDPVRVHGYCATCPDHSRVWSCPPFAVPALEGLPPWEHALLAILRTPIAPGTLQADMVASFHDSRRLFRTLLLAAEAQNPGTTALVAGYCQGCECCTRPAGVPCPTPSRLRYSLEALGFDVSALAEGLAGMRIQWPKEGVPEYLLTVGALLGPDTDRSHSAMMALWEERHG